MTKAPLETTTKPTVNDIARVAGVSLATVDRVINERPGVRSGTIEKVRKAISQLGYVRDTAAANLARRRIYNLHVILPDAHNEFISALETAVALQSEKLMTERTKITTARVDPFDPQDLVAELDGLRPGATHGVALFGPETPSVRDAVNRAVERGIAVVALVSDLPSSDRDHFVGIDNVAAGRTAAQLMGRFVAAPGKVLVLTGSRLARDHLERRQGFDLVMADAFPGIEVIASVEGRDDADRIYQVVSDVLRAHPDLRGIYSTAAGCAGLVRGLKERAGARDLTVIAHDLTPVSQHALEDGILDAVISQDTGHLIRSAVRLLRAKVDNVPHNPAQERIRIDIYIKENVPSLAPV